VCVGHLTDLLPTRINPLLHTPCLSHLTIPSLCRSNSPLARAPIALLLLNHRYGSLRSKSQRRGTRCARPSEPPPIDQHAHAFAVRRIYYPPLTRRAVVHFDTMDRHHPSHQGERPLHGHHHAPSNPTYPPPFHMPTAQPPTQIPFADPFSRGRDPFLPGSHGRKGSLGPGPQGWPPAQGT
jgi:hypothetical protein